MATQLEREEIFIDWMIAFMIQCDRGRIGYLENAEQAQFLYDTVMERWVPGTSNIISGRDSLNPSAPSSAAPMVKGIVRDATHILLKHDPAVRVRPYDVNDSGLAADVTTHLYEAWRNRSTQALKKIRLSQQGCLISGVEVLAVQPWLDALGELHHQIEVVPRVDMWFDPVFSDIDHRVVIRRYWFPESQLGREFGDDALEIALTSRANYAQPSRHNIFDANQYDFGGIDDTAPPDYWHPTDEGLFPVYEIWIPHRYLNPDQFTDREITDSPYGRRITVLNHEVIENIPNPNAGQIGENKWIGHRSHPYVIHECFRKFDRDGFSGLYNVEGIIHDLEQIQWEVNELTRLAFIAAAREAEPNYWVAEGQTRSTDYISHEPGKMFYYDPSVAQSPPIQVQSPNLGAMMVLLQQRQSSLRDVSGVRGPIIGGDPVMGTSHTPAGTMRAIQESSTIRLWGPLGNTELAIEGVAWRLLGNMQQHKRVGSYATVNISGVDNYSEWTQDHIYNEYRLEVVAGMSTVLRDIDKMNLNTQIFSTVAPMFLQPSPTGLRAVKAYLISLNDPAAYEYIELANEMIAGFESEVAQRQEQQQQQPEGIDLENMTGNEIIA